MIGSLGPARCLVENRAKALPEIAKVPEWITTDGYGPIDAGDDPPLIGSLRAIAESRFGEIRNAVALDFGSPIIEALRRGTGGFKLGAQMSLADNTEIARPDRAALFPHLTEKRCDARSLVIREEFGERIREAPTASQIAFALAVPLRPRNSRTKSATVRHGMP